MSFDIVVLRLKPEVSMVSSLEGIEERDTHPLGTSNEIKKLCDHTISGIEWIADEGVYLAPEGFAIEFSIPDKKQPSSLHLTLHFGDNWEPAGSSAFDELIRNLYLQHHWQSFSVSDNSSLLQE